MRLIFFAILLLLATPFAALTGPYDVPSTIPDTGQTKCYDAVGNEISCAGTGQDGAYNISPMSFTKLSGGIMVQDNVTQLIWEVKTDDGGVQDKDNTYNWNAAIAYCEDLPLGGYNDWRLPSREELRSIVDYSIPYPGPTIDTSYFPNTVSSYYWSSTTYASSTGSAWHVYFSSGLDNYSHKSYSRYVRCVRGGQ